MSKKFSFSLSNELMGLLEREFRIPSLIENYEKALREGDEKQKEKIAEDVFGGFGRKLSERLCTLESKYRDRSADVVYAVSEQTGHPFPSIQQRLLEIGILAVMNSNKWTYDEISYKRLAYMVSECVVNQALDQALGKEIADEVPCRHLCMEYYRGICRHTGVGDAVSIDMPSRISDKNGRCVFGANYHHEGSYR